MYIKTILQQNYIIFPNCPKLPTRRLFMKFSIQRNYLTLPKYVIMIPFIQ